MRVTRLQTPGGEGRRSRARAPRLAAAAALLASACTTFYVGRIDGGSAPREALAAVSACFREIGLRPYTEHPDPRLRQYFASESFEGVPADWYAERLFVELSRKDPSFAVRLLATYSYDEVAAKAATALKSCLEQRSPGLPFSIAPHRMFDVR